jgi:hypothetical protein
MDFSESGFTLSGEIGLGNLKGFLKDFGGAPLGESAKVGEVLAFEVGRVGTWDEKYMVEWLLNGETYKAQPAADPKIHVLRFKSDHLDPGPYTLAVRILDKGAGKIQAHRSVRFSLKEATGGLPSELPSFKVTASREEYDGPAINGPLENGEIVALRALVSHPETEEPLLTNLVWQLYDEKGAPVSRYQKQVQASETGGQREYRVRFLLEGLPNGRYTAALTHQLALNPEVRSQASAGFTLFQPVTITRIWATDAAGDVIAKESLRNDKLPHLYVTFVMGKGIEAVQTRLTARNKQTGAEIHSLEREYQRKDQQEQRTGVRLAAGSVKAGDEVEFEAAITSPPGKAQTARTLFKVEGYPISVKAPSRLQSGDQGRFAISVPDEFDLPFRVDVTGRGLTIGRPSAEALSGTVSGFSESGEKTGTLHATVTDAAGRAGQATVSVTIVAPEQESLPRTALTPSTQPSTQPKPAPTARADSAPSSAAAKVDYAAAGRERTAQWWSKFVSDLVPDCLGDIRQKLLNAFGTLKFSHEEYLRWGSGPLYSPSHRQEMQAAEKVVLRDVIVPMAKRLPGNECTTKFAQSVAVHAQSVGLTSSSYAFLSELKAAMSQNSRSGGVPSAGGGGKNFYAVPYYIAKTGQYAGCKVVSTNDRYNELKQLMRTQAPAGATAYSAWGPWDRQTAERFSRCVQGKPFSYLQDAETTGHSEDFPKFPDGCR